MAYRACFACELLFEVDAGASTSSRCPVCGSVLADYEPDSDELGTAPDVTHTATEANPAIVKTMSFEGLSEKVREQLNQRAAVTVQETPNFAAPKPRAPMPRPVSMAPPVVAPAIGAPPIVAPPIVAPPVVAPPIVAPPIVSRPMAPPVVAPPMARPVAAPIARPVPAAVPAAPVSKDGRPQRTKVLEAVEVQQLAADAPAAPAMPAAPEPPPPMSDQPDALAATMAMQEDPARPLPPMPAPISARMAAPAHAVDDTPPIDEVDAVPDDSVADQFSPATVMALPKQKKKGGGGAMVAIIIVAAVLVLGGGGFAAWWFLLRGPAEAPVKPTTEVEAPPVELGFAEKLGKQLDDGQARLPRVPGAEALAEATWIAGGPEGMATSLGPVTGMPSTLIRDNTVESDDDGEWVSAMRLRLSEGSPGADSMLLIGVPTDVTARDFLRMANAGRMAGHGRFGLVVEKAEAAGERGMIPFWLHPRTASLPESGAVLVRIGRIGLHVSAQNGAGEVISAGEPSLPRQGDQLDLEALGRRVAELKAAHADIKRVIVFPIGDMELTALAGLMAQVHAGPDGARFDELAIALLK